VFDKNLWGSLIDFHAINNYPTLPCPYCSKQKLTLDADSLAYRHAPTHPSNSALSRSYASKTKTVADTFKESELLGILVGLGMVIQTLNTSPAKVTGFFKCEGCLGNVAMAGTALCPKKGTSVTTANSLKVEYFSPPIPIFPLPSATPPAVAEEIRQAFNHFHCDLTASGSKIRRAMEKICDSLNHKKRTLHDSIESMSSEYPKEANWLRSLKLVGNEASHSDKIDEEDLLSAFQVLEAVMDLFRRKVVEEEVGKAIPKLDSKFKRPALQNSELMSKIASQDKE